VFIVAGIACLAMSEAQDHGAAEPTDPADRAGGAGAPAR